MSISVNLEECRRTPFIRHPDDYLLFRNRTEAEEYKDDSKLEIVKNVYEQLIETFRKTFPKEHSAFMSLNGKCTPFEQGYKICQLIEEDASKKGRLLQTDFVSINIQYEKQRLAHLPVSKKKPHLAKVSEEQSPVIKPIAVNMNDLKILELSAEAETHNLGTEEM